MRETVELSGVILFAQPIGEYDRRLVILTRERGKITAFARGARRQKSPLIAVTNPFVFAVFSLYEGRDAYTLVAADASEYFSDLAQKMPGVFYGYYFLELSDYYGREGIESGSIVNLLFVTFRALMREQLPPSMIRRIFEIRMLAENGDYAPPDEAGNMNEAAFQALRYASYCPVSRLYAFSLDEEAAGAFSREAVSAMKRTIDKSFKSLAVIDDLR